MIIVVLIECLLQDCVVLLFIVLVVFFCGNVVLVELIGVKIFVLEDIFGIDLLNWNLFGQIGLFSFIVGILLWLVVFIMIDMINEFFGKCGVCFILWLVVVLIVYGFLFVFVVILLVLVSWWVILMDGYGVLDYQVVFVVVFGQGMWIIVGLLVVFLFGQLIDVVVFYCICQVIGECYVWLCVIGFIVIFQVVDSFVVIWIVFVFGLQYWLILLFLVVSSVNYIYKMGFVIVLILLLYLMWCVIICYLGVDRVVVLCVVVVVD